MQVQELHEVIRLLDRKISKDGARLTIRYCDQKTEQYAHTDPGCEGHDMIANEAGFLRLGVELLKAGVAPLMLPGESTAVDVDVNYLIAEDSDVTFRRFERRWPPMKPQPAEDSGGAGGLVIPVLLVAFVLLAVVGLGTVIRGCVAQLS